MRPRVMMAADMITLGMLCREIGLSTSEACDLFLYAVGEIHALCDTEAQASLEERVSLVLETMRKRRQ